MAAGETEPTPNFEFQALRWARNYRLALLEEFGAHLHGEVIEVGAGEGQFTELLVELPSVRRVVAVEPEPRFCAELRRRSPGTTVVEGTVAVLAPGTECDALVSVNVLEHIQEDMRELTDYARLLRKRRGWLCLFVPARQELYAQIDRDFGHYRRYAKPELAAKLRSAGFEVARLFYFNWAGYFAWWANFRLLGKRSFAPRAVRFFDRAIFPMVHAFESRLARPPFGQSLLAVGRATPNDTNSRAEPRANEPLKQR